MLAGFNLPHDAHTERASVFPPALRDYMNILHINYFAVVLTTAITRGAAIVAFAWLAYEASGDLKLVGLVFLTSNLTKIVLGPVLGALIDSWDRKALVIISQPLKALAFALPFIFGWGAPDMVLLSMAFVGALGPMLLIGSLDAIQQTLTEARDYRRVTAIAGGLRQGGMVAGGGLTGALIAYVSVDGMLLVIIAICLISAGLAFFLPALKGAPGGKKENFLNKVKNGVLEFSRQPRLLRLALIYGFGFSIGQAANVLLPALVKDGIGGDSFVYGIVDGAWALGGVVAAVILTRYFFIRSPQNLEYSSAVLLGAVTVCAVLLSQVWTAILVFLLLGGLFSVVRISCEGHLQEICPNETIGRVRTHFQTTVGLFGLMVHGTTAFFEGIPYAAWFGIWGGLCLVVTLIIWRVEKQSMAQVEIAATE